MSNGSARDRRGTIGMIVAIVGAVIGLLAFVLGGGFVYDKWYNVPDIAYTILPTYKLGRQSFGGVVVQNRGRATAHEVAIRLPDIGVTIEEVSLESDEIPELKDGGAGASSLTIWLDRMAAGSSTTVYVLTSGPGRFDNLVVTAEEGRGHLAVEAPTAEIVTFIALVAVLVMAITVVMAMLMTRGFRATLRLPGVVLDWGEGEEWLLDWPYDFIDEFAQARQRGHTGSQIEPHLTANCAGEMMRAIFEHPPAEVDKFTTLTYSVRLPESPKPMELVGFIGIETERPTPSGEDRRLSRRRPDNAVQFEVLIDDESWFRKQKQTSEWEEFSIRILPEDIRGEMLSVCFRTNGLGDNSYNWAVWGEPQLIETAGEFH